MSIVKFGMPSFKQVRDSALESKGNVPHGALPSTHPLTKFYCGQIVFSEDYLTSDAYLALVESIGFQWTGSMSGWYPTPEGARFRERQVAQETETASVRFLQAMEREEYATARDIVSVHNIPLSSQQEADLFT